MIVFYVLLALVLLTLALMCICFFKIFYSSRKPLPREDEFPTPDGAIYDPFRDQMVKWIKEVRAMKKREVFVTSFDGLRLFGSYYEYENGAPIEILFHGYRGTAERDLSGAVYRCFALGRNALIVDHRASGRSEGHVITFGANESKDCKTWVDFVVENIDKDAKIIITGISMGAATVMTAASKPLPKNVVGVLADCGYTSAEEIIKKVMRDMKLPANLLYPLVRLSAKLFGNFDPKEASPIDSMKSCELPIIFLHGLNDDYVPFTMSKTLFDTCTSKNKRLVLTPNAGHGLCFPVDMEGYFKEVRAFFDPILKEDERQ